MEGVRNGSIVRLPDATIGEATWVSHGTNEARVVHGDVFNGRGPWNFRVSQLERATPEEAAAYLERCAARRAA